MLEELTQELGLNEEQTQKLTEEVTKSIQSETDKVRTEYSKRVKELEKFKPVEKSEMEIELDNTKMELERIKFQSNLKQLGVSDDLAKYIRQDINIEEFSQFYKGFASNTQNDFIPNQYNTGNNGITKEQFKSMGIEERTKLYSENPSLYQQLKSMK
ncbi:MAG: hypothetical protein LBS02_17845 [Hungatella sp.]|jgi:ribosomal protein L29|nr:hypothetical protein [Hungatella sp.]